MISGRQRCPACGAGISEPDLLQHPPGDPSASRALSRRYCPACGAEVAVATPIRWWHALLFAAPFVVIYLKPQLAAIGLPDWGYTAVQVSLSAALLLSLRRVLVLARQQQRERPLP